jgi:hypothetical protein
MNNTRDGGGDEHKVREKQVMDEYGSRGWKVINLHGSSPDLIASKDGNIIAIEVLGINLTRRGKRHSWTYEGKMERYKRLGFDDVKIETFEYSKTPHHYYLNRK